MNDNIDYCHHDSKTLNTNYYQVLNGGKSSGKTFQTINMYEQKYNQLQSNWNSLREYYKRKAEETKDSTALYDKWTKYSSVVDKMNELEGVDNETNK